VLCTVSLTTLLGLDDAPGELAGYGPLPAHLAREMAREGVLRRVLTDPVTGLVVSVDGHAHPEGFSVGPPDPEDPPGGSPPEDGPSGGSPPEDGPPGGSPPGGGSPGGERPGDDAPGRCSPSADGQFPVDASSATAEAAVSVRVVSCPVARAGGGRYRPGRAMDRFVRVRDQRCTAPGCRMPAVRCDLDHVVRHPDGPTCPCNLHPLCRHHHRLKHLTRTRVTRSSDGSTHWVLPTGHEYVRPPTPALPAPRVACRRDPTRVEDDLPVWVPPPPWDDAGPGIAALDAAIAAAERASAVGSDAAGAPAGGSVGAPQPAPRPVDEEPPF
jgi:hypothetical protein